jgi:hypothetical protein
VNSVLNIETARQPDGSLHVVLRGKINEHFDGSAIVDAAAGAPVRIDASGVRHITSIGVRELERFFERVGRVTLVEVSPAVAVQLVLLPTLAARAEVLSAQLPFTCDACGAEKSATVPFAKGAATESAPICPCGTRMALDGIAEQYLPE